MGRNIVDKGWANMEAILEKELPINKKKNRFIPFFILIVIGLISYGCYYALNHQNQKTNQSDRRIIASSSMEEGVLPQNQSDEFDMNKTANLEEKQDQPIKNLFLEKVNSKVSISEKSLLKSSNNQRQNPSTTINPKTKINAQATSSTKQNIVTQGVSLSKNPNTTDDNTRSNAMLVAQKQANPLQDATKINLNEVKTWPLSAINYQKVNSLTKENKQNISSNSMTSSNLITPLKVITPHFIEIYLMGKTEFTEYLSGLEFGVNKSLIKRNKLGLYASLGLSWHRHTAKRISKTINSNQAAKDIEVIGWAFLDENNSESYIRSLGYENHNGIAPKLGVGLDYKITSNLSLRNELSAYYYIRNIQLNPIQNSLDEQILLQNKLIFSNATSINYNLSSSLKIYTGFQISINPEYQIQLPSSDLKYRSSELIIGAAFKF